MKKLLVLVFILSIMPIAHATHVRGHYRSNGTYVTPYNRTRMNYTKSDNSLKTPYRYSYENEAMKMVQDYMYNQPMMEPYRMNLQNYKRK